MDYFIFINPISSSLIKYYEQTKSNHARDIDHLVSFNKNGLWIKETTSNKERIITASKLEDFTISQIEIFEFNKDFKLKEKFLQTMLTLGQTSGLWKK